MELAELWLTERNWEKLGMNWKNNCNGDSLITIAREVFSLWWLLTEEGQNVCNIMGIMVKCKERERLKYEGGGY